MKHNLNGNQNGMAALQPFVPLEDRNGVQRPGKTVHDGILPPEHGGNLPARIRRRLAGIGQADLEEALLRGLAWGNGRGLR